jgi:hypothetical protein
LVDILTYNDAGLSGTPKLARFLCNGAYYYAKVYPTASATASGSDDDPVSDLYLLDDAALSGVPVVLGFDTDGVEYYFKAYPTAGALSHFDGDTDCTLTDYRDAALSGTPRIAQTLVDGTEYYWKAYPTKVLNNFIPYAIQSYVYADAWDADRGIVVVESTVYQDGA